MTIADQQTVSISGGSQALARTETVRVRLGEQDVLVRTPSLLAAILLKARAIRSDHRDQDREDLVLLLSCVEDPITLAADDSQSVRLYIHNLSHA